MRIKIFSYLYNKMRSWSLHRRAPYFLAGVSFIESSFFPIPPDVMLISMGLVKPDRAWRYALITTGFSVLGGIFGYLIGCYGLTLVEPLIKASSYEALYKEVALWFQKEGIWVILIAGFTPIPYKIFTIAAGALKMAFLPFVLASIVGRGLRFYLVSALMYWCGGRIEGHLRRYVDAIGWVFLLLITLAFCLYHWVY